MAGKVGDQLRDWRLAIHSLEMVQPSKSRANQAQCICHCPMCEGRKTIPLYLRTRHMHEAGKVQKNAPNNERQQLNRTRQAEPRHIKLPKRFKENIFEDLEVADL